MQTIFFNHTRTNYNYNDRSLCKHMEYSSRCYDKEDEFCQFSKILKREKLSQPSSGWLCLSLRLFSSFSFLKISTETRPAFPPESILGPCKEYNQNCISLTDWTINTQIRFHITLWTSPWTQFSHLWLARSTRRWQVFIWVLSTARPPPGWWLVGIRASSCFWALPWRRLVWVWSFSLLWSFSWRWLVRVWVMPALSPFSLCWQMRIMWMVFTW